MNKNDSTLFFFIVLYIITLISHINAQRDLMAIDEKNDYSLNVVDQHGRALTIAGVDPLNDRPKFPAMCYTTPWNPSGYDVTSNHVARRLHYIAPAWFILHLNVTKSDTGKSQLSVRISGHDNVNVPFLKQFHESYIKRQYVPKITPRISLQISQQAIALLLNRATHVSIIESLLDLAHTGGLPRVGVYKGYDGITLEMPAIWDHIPAYPNSILSFTEANTEAHPDASRAAVDPNDIHWDENDPRQRAAGLDYGTYKYNFTNPDLQKHPRHIINMFVRKLGTALQAFDKHLLIVTSPYRHDDPSRGQSEVINSDITMDQLHSLQCTKPDQTLFPKAFSHVDAYYLSPYVDYFNIMTYDFAPLSNKDIHHIRSIETQVRTVATTRIGYTPKRMWRIFNGRSSIYENMFLEDFIRQQDNNDSKSTDIGKEKQLVASLQAEIDLLQNRTEDQVATNILKRLKPHINYMLCFNIYHPDVYSEYNDLTQKCFEYAEPGQWWHTLDTRRSQRTYFVRGNNNSSPEEESESGSDAIMKEDTFTELTDSINLHNKKLILEFKLDPDEPWPELSYGWSVSPVPWLRNGLTAISVPFQCTKQLFNSWQDKSETVHMKRLLSLKSTLPKTSISRDLVIPIKLEHISAKFEIKILSKDFQLLNNTLSSLCAERIDPSNTEMQAACGKHADLLQQEEKTGFQRKTKSGSVDESLTIQVPAQQLDWSFPSIQLDAHIQKRIDMSPRYNKVRVLAGMNWYGYLYKARDPLYPHDQDPLYLEPIALNAEQAEAYVNKWKGQIDIKHDLASGDRFFVFRDGPQNKAVSALWYPSYLQLHRKLHQIRSLADGIAIWDCGQGLAEFEKLI